MSDAPPPDVRRIVLFDGVCSVCDRAVHFIIDRDRGGRFQFAALQSEVGAELLARAGLSGINTMVLIEGDHAYTRSTAALRIARRLDGAWPALYVGMVVPKGLRDLAYRLFAAARYRLFGRLSACRVPSAAERGRFLDLPGARVPTPTPATPAF